MKSLIKNYLSLMKFGILFGNMFPLLAGFALADGKISILTINTIIFGFLIMGCGCVLNNCYDVDIDSVMERTKNRVLPQKLLTVKSAIIFGIVLGLVSFIWGWYFLNIKTVVAGFVGLLFYTVFYTILTKRKSGVGVHFGSISGAIPPVIGYLAVSNSIEMPLILLFFMLIVWQIPHSFAIEIFRYEDFKNAKIKTVPSYRGIKWVKYSINCYIILYILCNFLLCFYTNIVHWASIIVAILWLKIAIDGLKLPNAFEDCKKWAKKVFFFSIINIMVVSLSIFCGIFI